MVITKYLCDRCKQEINEEQLCRIGWLEFGFESPKIEQFDFCLNCKMAIMNFATNEVPLLRTMSVAAEEAQTDAEAAEQEEHSEVIQASAPRRARNKTTKDSIERQIAEGMYGKGKPIGEIAKSLNRSYQCVRNWVR